MKPNHLNKFYCLLLLLAASVAQADRLIELRIGDQIIVAEPVATPELRHKGLMGRKSLETNHGMLFVFPRSAYHSIWMKDTYIPLSVAFIDSSGKILNIAEMTPLSEDTHTAGGLAKYALEMNGGWFRAKNIWPGQKVEGLNKAPVAKE